MSTLHQRVYQDCYKLLNIKYTWITTSHFYGILPPFKMPEDPTEDIKKALDWLPQVEELKGIDAGEDMFAYHFKEGMKMYLTNRNVLYGYKNDILNKKITLMNHNPTESDINIAISRWADLTDACSTCNYMMRKLHYHKQREVKTNNNL